MHSILRSNQVDEFDKILNQNRIWMKHDCLFAKVRVNLYI